MSDSLRPPWTVTYQAPLSMGFSGKSTGVGCHFLLQEIFPTQGLSLGLLHCRQMLYHLSHQVSPAHLPPAPWPARHGLYNPWNSPGQSAGVGSFPLLQGIFPIQESNLGLPHCRKILYQLSHKGRPPRILGSLHFPTSGNIWTQIFPSW